MWYCDALLWGLSLDMSRVVCHLSCCVSLLFYVLFVCLFVSWAFSCLVLLLKMDLDSDFCFRPFPLLSFRPLSFPPFAC